MERVLNLVDKLKHQLEHKASVEELLATAQMIHAELLFAKGTDLPVTGKAAVMLPFVPVIIAAEQNGTHIEKATTRKPEEKIRPEEKIIEVLQVDE